MGRGSTRVWQVCAAAVAAAACLSAGSSSAQAPDPGFVQSGAEQYAKGRTRAADQLTHPEFQALSAPIAASLPSDDDALTLDPYRAAWYGGETRPVTITNRYGVALEAELYGPAAPRKRMPAVIAMPGNFLAESSLHAYSHDLAEAGYVVLGLEVQGGGGSGAEPPNPRYCQPGDWQEPQEMGIRERGPCAGMQEAAPPLDPEAAARRQAEAYADLLVTQDDDHGGQQAAYDRATAPQVFGALDAVRWLRSADNPWRDRIDVKRIGIIGHSLGSMAALAAGNGDPEGRFGAVVSLDTEVPMLAGVKPAVPTMFQQQELGLAAPRHHAPDARASAYRDFERFADAGVPSMVVVPDASLHLDFAFINFAPVWALASTGPWPTAAIELNASRHGERVSVYYARAWFDRWLGGDRKATGRLLTTVFPESADDTSIGQGRWVPGKGNVPYEIGGHSVRRRLSPLFPSPVAIDRLRCADVRDGCPK